MAYLENVNSNFNEEHYKVTLEKLGDYINKVERLRDRLDSGILVYVDGFVCYQSPKYISFENNRPQLTDYAKSNISECCLDFTQIKSNLFSKQEKGQDDTLAFIIVKLDYPENRDLSEEIEARAIEQAEFFPNYRMNLEKR
ncbi:hypothetical protein STPL106120_10215 [Streptococcus pluranimalium]|uniref:hypothetical protein n=1 Tax=Streptococcus pluranimalium TaxID=82348 RepID=UPI0039ED0742